MVNGHTQGFGVLRAMNAIAGGPIIRAFERHECAMLGKSGEEDLHESASHSLYGSTEGRTGSGMLSPHTAQL